MVEFATAFVWNCVTFAACCASTLAPSAGFVAEYNGGTTLVPVTSPSHDGMKLVLSWPPETLMSR